MFCAIRSLLVSLSNLFDLVPGFSEVILLQLALLLIVTLFFFINNSFYLLLYFFIFTFLVGLFISVYQMELFTGFLYVIEITVVFMLLLVLFYLNFKGSTTVTSSTNKYLYVSFILLICFTPMLYAEKELYLPCIFNTIDLWDNYYACLSNTAMNDFIGLYLSYYFINSYEFLLIGWLLFLGSILCITLFNLVGSSKSTNHLLLRKFLQFFVDTLDFYFLRKQNLVNQNNTQPGLRIIKNKS